MKNDTMSCACNYVINIGGLNVDDFVQVYSLPIFRLIQYVVIEKLTLS